MMSDSTVHGPIDFVLLEFTGGHDLSTTASALIDLIERGHRPPVRPRCHPEGRRRDVLGARTRRSRRRRSSFISGARSGLLGDDDMQAAADTMLPGTTGVLLMYENTWAMPFVAAALDAGGTMIATKRIPAEDVIAVLDELEAAD